MCDRNMSTKASAIRTVNISLLPVNVSTIHSAIKTETVTEAISHAASTRSLATMPEPPSSIIFSFSSSAFIVARDILNSTVSLASSCVNAEDQGLTYKLQGSALSLAARVPGIDSRLVLACGKLRGVRDEALHLVPSAPRSLHIQSLRISRESHR